MRRKSSILINEDLLIDIGPDINTSSFDLDIPIENVHYCLQTHHHADHFDPELIISRNSEYGTVNKNKIILVGSAKTIKKIDSIIQMLCDYGSLYDDNADKQYGIEIKEIIPFKEYLIGEYKIVGYPANHDIKDDGLLYSIEYKDILIFYGLDTSLIFDEIWNELKNQKKQFDVFILDHTYGIGFQSTDHLSAKDFIEHVNLIKRNNLLKKTGKIFASHISHEGIMLHDELQKFAEKNGYNIAYDGLQIKIVDGYLTTQ
ncbi:hypothetical protein ES705_20148 [subsurface metagenome]